MTSIVEIPEDEFLIPAEDEHNSICKILKEESRELRWPVLLCACLLTFGGSYTMDFPGAFGTGKEHTIEQVFHAAGKPYTQSMNQFLYSVYSWPNTVLAIVGGLLIDKYLGLRRAMLLFSALVFAGTFVFFLGISSTKYSLLVCGRILYGLGGESLGVAQSAFVARWFRGKRGMSLAFGICISFSRVGSSLNFIFSPLFASHFSVTFAALMGIGACVVTLVSCIILVLADAYAVRTGYIEPEERDNIDEAGLPPLDGEVEEGKNSVFETFSFLPNTFWILSLICVCAYMSIYPFIGIAKNFFEVKYGYTSEYAGQIISSYQITGAIMSPIIGLLVDGCGRNTLWLLLSLSALVGIHVAFVLTMVPALCLMVTMGVFYSFMVSGLWPSIPLAVPETIVGFAYGVMTSCQNIGFAFFPLLIGRTLDRHIPHPSNNDSGSGSGSADESASSLSGSSSGPSSMLAHALDLLRSSSGSLSDASSSSGFGSGSGSGSSTYSASSSSSAGGSGSGSSSGDDGSLLPTMDGFRATEYMFMGAALLGVIACVCLIVVDLRQGGFLSASIKRREMITSGQQDDEEDRSLLHGIIPESERTPLREENQ